MPRGPRDDAPGVVHHVMVRGIERRLIFHDDADREALLRRLSRLLPELRFRCFAWALMPNHLHLVVESGEARVSRLMARLGTGYARYFNERHDRVGHLFQNRFRSRRVVGERDLVGLILYVCRNPLEGGLAADPLELERFPWCGLGALTGARPPRAFESVAETLALFDRDPVRARRQLRGHLRTLEPTDELAPELPPIPPPIGLRTPPPPAALAELVHEICIRFGICEAELRSHRRGRLLVEARRTLASRAARELGVPGSQIARALGVTRSGVSRMLSRER